MSYANLLPYLLNNAMVAIIPAKTPQPPFSRGYNLNATCAYHGRVPGHSIEHCMTLKHKVWSLIDAGWLKFEKDNSLWILTLWSDTMHRYFRLNVLKSLVEPSVCPQNMLMTWFGGSGKGKRKILGRTAMLIVPCNFVVSMVQYIGKSYLEITDRKNFHFSLQNLESCLFVLFPYFS